jgi:predicted pyridoxine 5'-phosphate oxidase superfamily flavin-nucleotide-binding protein
MNGPAGPEARLGHLRCKFKSFIMTAKFLSLTSTPAVLRAQESYYGAARAVSVHNGADSLNEGEISFIQERDSFYLSTVTETGWPYIQHRGGKPGFLKVLGPQSLAFADYKGNRQLISTGSIAAGSRVALFLMDYPERARLKILGQARIEDARTHADLVKQLAEPEQRGKVERLFFIDVIALDWNCSQYITPRYTLAEIEKLIRPLQARIAGLTRELENYEKP